MLRIVFAVAFFVLWAWFGGVLIVRMVGQYRARTTLVTAPKPLAMFYYESGSPLAGGSFYVYYTGTTRMAVSYRSISLASEPGNVNPNPVPLNWLGQGTRIYLEAGEYDIVPIDKHGRTLDPITIGMAK